ncbi:MAG: response regulator [Deltaproteobacteria bacterium]|nr:response regulator [Deltaproteobacteria bacterium]
MIDPSKFKPLRSTALLSREGASKAAEVVGLGRGEVRGEGVDGVLGGSVLKREVKLPHVRDEMIVDVRVVGEVGEGTPASPLRTRMRFARATEDVMREIDRFLARAADAPATPRPPTAAPGAAAAQPAPGTAGGEIGVGSVIGGRYQVTAALTPDSAFHDFEGVDRNTGNPVLLRALREDHRQNPAWVAQFRELHLAARAVQHPHVLRLFDYVSEPGREVVVSEHARGPRLTQLLKTRGAFALDSIGRLSRHVLAGIGAVHAKGLPYGCIHPGRVRISSGFNARVSDVAVAQMLPLAHIAADDDAVAYVPPETRLGAVPSERSEVYSFGMLLYAVALGRTPFSAEERAGLDIQPDLEPTPPGEARPAVPEALVPIIERATAVEPSARFATLDDLAAALLPLFEDAPVERPANSRILVVDDDPSLRYLIVSLLRSAGHEVLVAENGIDALEIAFKEPLDLICLDIRMPRMDGFEVCMVLRSDERTKKVKILVVSAVTSQDTVTLMESLGATEFLPKPFEEPDLLGRVAKLLGR